MELPFVTMLWRGLVPFAHPAQQWESTLGAVLEAGGCRANLLSLQDTAAGHEEHSPKANEVSTDPGNLVV